MGIPFMMIGTILNGIIRADGSPKYSMISMVTGAIINILSCVRNILCYKNKLGLKEKIIITILSVMVVKLLFQKELH